MTQKVFSSEDIDRLTAGGIVNFIEHENGIYEMIYLAHGTTVVDRYFEMLGHLARQATLPYPDLRILLDLSHYWPPMTYAVNKAREFLKIYRYRAPIRHVFLVGGGAVPIQLADTFMRSIRVKGIMWRFLVPAQRDEAISWLLSKT